MKEQWGFPEGGGLQTRLMIFFSLLSILFISNAYAQTTDYHVGVGASPLVSVPLENYDMSGLKAGPYGPASGKTLQVFVLWGAFSRNGQWMSKFLPRDVRRGLGNILMFEGGEWQPLQPVGVQHGLEIPFAEKIAALMPNETIGLIVSSAPLDQLATQVVKAMMAVPCEVIAFVQLRDSSMEKLKVDAIRRQLHIPGLPVADMTPLFKLAPSDHDQLEAVYDKGFYMADQLLKILNVKVQGD